MRSVGEALRAVRIQQGLSLARVAKKSGGRVSVVVLGSYERGDRNINVDYLYEVAAVYGVDPRNLLPIPAGDVRAHIADADLADALRTLADRLDQNDNRGTRLAVKQAVDTYSSRLKDGMHPYYALGYSVWDHIDPATPAGTAAAVAAELSALVNLSLLQASALEPLKSVD